MPVAIYNYKRVGMVFSRERRNHIVRRNARNCDDADCDTNDCAYNLCAASAPYIFNSSRQILILVIIYVVPSA